ncbi:hypothetical protein FNV1501 [Fusobacterium vincentii ATCC 49256]|uniref:Uncharacterized protein n=1 Tax=Fusobacterium vincentii ATCC 49256 TaxID=209882 RepID=Q7P750_FUSVC|nr:hypothetical protein FNV1501 [Fusobacterium vincentii ATCC 49256]
MLFNILPYPVGLIIFIYYIHVFHNLIFMVILLVIHFGIHIISIHLLDKHFCLMVFPGLNFFGN